MKIFHCKCDQLLSVREPLRCLGSAGSVAVDTADRLLACDMDNNSACVVSVSKDTVIRQLQKPAEIQASPNYISVLGETILVCYYRNTLVTYHRHSLIPGRMLETPEGLDYVSSITTDHHSSFLVTGGKQGLFVLDYRGNLRLKIHRSEGPRDCAVVQSELWLGTFKDYISILTSH